MPSHGQPQVHPRKRVRLPADAPMPPGFFRCLRGRTVGRPELRLAAAVLEDAVHSLRQTHGAGEYHRRLLYWELEQWFASRSSAPLFSFERVCSMLGLSADELRSHLQRWAESRLGGAAPMLLEWNQPVAKRAPLWLVARARFPVPAESPMILEVKTPPPDSKDADGGKAVVMPGSRSA